MGELISKNNAYIKYLNSLKDKSNRNLHKQFLVEGEHLVSCAKNSGLLLRTISVNDDTNIKVSDIVYKKLATTLAPQKIMSLCKMKEEVAYTNQRRILILDDVSDPVNLGSLIRSALGFGMDLVIMSLNTCDLYNDKTIRTSQGAIFFMDTLRCDLLNILPLLKVDIYGTYLKNAIDVRQIKTNDSYALILGNESIGMNIQYMKYLKENIKIEMDKRLESLNVGVAGGILMFYLKGGNL